MRVSTGENVKGIDFSIWMFISERFLDFRATFDCSARELLDNIFLLHIYVLLYVFNTTGPNFFFNAENDTCKFN